MPPFSSNTNTNTNTNTNNDRRDDRHDSRHGGSSGSGSGSGSSSSSHHRHHRHNSPDPDDIPCCEECERTRTGNSGGCPCRLYSKQRRTTLPENGCRTCGCKGCNPLDRMANAGPKLFVGQVPSDCSERRLAELFEKYGRVVDVHILRDRDGRSRNCGFVTLESTKQAKLAMDSVNKKVALPPRKTPLTVSFADNKNK